MPDFDTGIWFGLMAPAGTPRPVVDKLAAAVAQDDAVTPDAVAPCASRVSIRSAAAPTEFSRFIGSELTRWSDVARAAGLKS